LAETLQKSADRALYWGKANGKNLCALASEIGALQLTDAGPRGPAHLHAIVAMIDDELHTSEHSDTVAGYAAALGRALSLPSEALFRLRHAGLLHDIGKVAIPQEILLKQGSLSDAEFAEIRRHPVVGAMILRHAGLAEESAWVRHHHERLDGRGYPDGLREDEIPLESRILFVADAFEAMTSDRPYRAGMEVEAALVELRACAGTQFDPGVVDVLCRLVRDDELVVAPRRQRAGAPAVSAS
jgi:putative nucleotidyltransferase with HDIG domain